MMMIGKNVKPGVIGGVVKNSSGAYVAADIDSASGGVAGADIPAAETHVAAARTLGAVLGIPAEVLADDFVASAGGKIINQALLG